MALVIGNSVYAGLPPLPACAASVNVVSAALKRVGFAVTERLNPSNGTMGAAIGAFGDAVAASSAVSAVVYVCGYATEFDGRVFLLPASARLERETDALTQGLVARLLAGGVTGPEVQAGVLLLDTADVPGKGGGVRWETVFGALAPGVGLAGSHSRVSLASGPTPLATAVAAGLSTPVVEAQSMLQDLRLSLDGAPGLSVAVLPAARSGWLAGGAPVAPPPAVAPPAVAPPGPGPVGAGPAHGPAPGTPANPNEADRRRIQESLRRLGYYAGRGDGMMGAETVAAVRRFQHELGAAMTGRLTVEQVARLLAGPQ